MPRCARPGGCAFPFLGIWAIEQLHASQGRLGGAYLAGAIVAAVAGYAPRPPLGSPRSPAALFCAVAVLRRERRGARLAVHPRRRCLAASTWGFLVVVNPALATLLQLRLTRWTAAWLWIRPRPAGVRRRRREPRAGRITIIGGEMTDVLIYGDSIRVPELRHELPIGVPDPFLYAERDGVEHAAISSMEIPRLEEAGGIVCHPLEEFGIDELVAAGDLTRDEIHDEVAVRAVQALGIRTAAVPFGFPLGLADRLRAAGVELRVERELFRDRRRVKTDAELAGIRRAQLAAEAAMDAARDLLRRAEAANGALTLDGEPLTVERVKAAIAQAFVAHDCTGDDFVVAHGPQSAIGHHMGAGAIGSGEPIVVDLWPRDNASACHADMTRTFCVGEAPAELRAWHRLVGESLERARAAVRAGATGRALFDESCEVFERAGYPTQRTKEPGTTLADGYYHSLGHGVGLEVHEAPGLGLTSQAPLVAGDVITLEPGLYRQGVGGCRLEDLLLVTEDGSVTLTDYPYALEP